MSGDNPLGTILGVWAHPDDETYLCGGLMARAAAAGDRVVCITATRGENGSPDEDRWPSGAALAAVRTCEMRPHSRFSGSPSTTGSTTPTVVAPTSTRTRQYVGWLLSWRTYAPTPC